MFGTGCSLCISILSSHRQDCLRISCRPCCLCQNLLGVKFRSVNAQTPSATASLPLSRLHSWLSRGNHWARPNSPSHKMAKRSMRAHQGMANKMLVMIHPCCRPKAARDSDMRIKTIVTIIMFILSMDDDPQSAAYERKFHFKMSCLSQHSFASDSHAIVFSLVVHGH